MNKKSKYVVYTEKFITLLSSLTLTGCLHFQPYYEANVDGDVPVTSRGCEPPTSKVEFLPSGIRLTVEATIMPDDAVWLALEAHTNGEPGRTFNFLPRTVIFSDTQSGSSSYINMNNVVVRDSTLEPYPIFIGHVVLPGEPDDFYVQLPSAQTNYGPTRFLPIHFHRRHRFYKGCFSEE